MHSPPARPSLYRWLLAAAFAVTIMAYWSGLHGGFLFDDYPNIVDNHGVQPNNASLPSLIQAALSSPSSEFKRPLASLSFAANFLVTGLDPFWMKLTNLMVHLLNGLLIFFLTKALLRIPTKSLAPRTIPAADFNRADIVAALVAAAWMLLPINLTGVLYIVQRMESMANLFVLIGLIGYVSGRCRMLALTSQRATAKSVFKTESKIAVVAAGGLLLCVTSITIPVAMGVLAKETAVMLPLYALLIEWSMFRFRRRYDASVPGGPRSTDFRIAALFLLVLVLPMLAGLAWMLPGLLKPETWAVRDFTLETRLLSEARIVIDYVIWTLLPTPDALSFYHDDFRISTGLLTPWTTLPSIVLLLALGGLALWLRPRLPIAALGIAMFLGCHLLTATILPLELIYEHRNYFASFGLLLTLVPLLTVPADRPFALPRWTLLGGLMLCWTALTALTAHAWGNELRLAEDLAARAPKSPRAQYELGRTYIIDSHYDPTSPFTQLAYAPLERSAALPDSSILPEQALIFMNARMHLPLKDAWWDSIVTKLTRHKPGVQDESSLGALTQCAREQRCDLPKARMISAFSAALAHPSPSSRLLATYGDYAWNILGDHDLGERMTEEAISGSPKEPAYRITLIRMLVVLGRNAEAKSALRQLEKLNVGGSLNESLYELRTLQGLQR